MSIEPHDQPAFSNGTMWEIWQERWCFRCVNDSPELVDRGEGCPLILTALCGKTPVEWVRQSDAEVYRKDGCDVANLYHCMMFRDEDDGPDPEPKPQPEPPDMEGLFPRPERHARMLIQPSRLVVS